MTLNSRCALCYRKDASFGAHHKNLNEGRTISSAAECRPMTLVSGSIRFMQIFAGFLWRGGVKRQWGNRKRRFSWLLVHRKWGQHYYIIIQSLVAFPLTPKYMTLSDLDWLFCAKFCFRAGLAGWHRATSENNCVKTNEDRPYCQRCKSSAGLYCSFWQYWPKVCANIRSGCLGRRR